MTPKEFWQLAFLAAIMHGNDPAMARHKADLSVTQYEDRFPEEDPCPNS